jgi:tripartite-type tricarboxylate transporter receptor subunit TctC
MRIGKFQINTGDAMRVSRWVVAVLCTTLPLMTWAQGNWPARPINLVVPYAPGGPTDIVARTIAASMSRSLGQSVIVENKVGAGGTIGTGVVARSAPDGYTFLIHHMAMATYPALWKKLPFDAAKDFAYVGQVVDVPMTLIGRKDLPAGTFAELLVWLQANQGKVNWANGGKGGVSELCTILFQKAIGFPMTSISFQGTAPALNALIGSQVDLMCDQTTQTVPHIKAGTVKFFGVTTRDRVQVLPDAPTLSEQGLKNFDMQVWHGIYAPRNTPKPVMDRMSAALRAAMKDPDVVRRMQELGAEIVPEAKMSAAGLESHLKSESEKWLPVIRDAGVEPQ